MGRARVEGLPKKASFPLCVVVQALIRPFSDVVQLERQHSIHPCFLPLQVRKKNRSGVCVLFYNVEVSKWQVKLVCVKFAKISKKYGRSEMIRRKTRKA